MEQPWAPSDGPRARRKKKSRMVSAVWQPPTAQEAKLTRSCWPRCSEGAASL